MKVTVEFLSLPNVVKMIGSKTITIEFPGCTVEELIRAIGEKYGTRVQQFLFDENGQFDMSFSIAINKREWIRHNQMSRALHDGDQVTVMLLAAGG